MAPRFHVNSFSYGPFQVQHYAVHMFFQHNYTMFRPTVKKILGRLG